jgi:rSAM/selenodomain-associated transferase 1
VNLIVIAKAPAPGRVKTRLCPPCTPEQAALLAEAALCDTLRAAAATRATRHVVALDGKPGGWLPDGFEVVAQRGGGLDERLAGAFQDVGGPALLIGMDTPQMTPRLLAAGLRALARADAVLGLAEDGGFWALGLQRPDPSLLLGVPMSAQDTGARQLERLRAAGLRVAPLPVLRDVDRIEDAYAVAARLPGSAFARRLAA